LQNLCTQSTIRVMTRRRWIADEVEGDRAALVGEHALHLARVLRARVGQEFDIAAGDRVRRGRVTSVNDAAGSGARVEFELGDDVDIHEPGDLSQAAVTLLLAVFKFDRMEWAIEKCTELGVAAIVPVIARRTDIHLAKAAEKRVERWRRIAVQASEQSRRNTVPEIGDPVKLANAVKQSGIGPHLPTTGRRCAPAPIEPTPVEPTRTEPTRIVLAETGKHVSLADIANVGGGPVVVAVGPEGGWTDEELALFAKEGWQSVSLGQNILRAETAAIAAVAVVMAAR
jgi:16S rRNA (uracil1498-N3)-methyltransferase